MTPNKRILILTADAGFGHRAAANAIAAALRERFCDTCDFAIANPMDDRRTPRLLRRTQDDYDQLVVNNPELYRFGYRTSDKSLPVGIVEQALIAMLYATLRDIVSGYQPDVIVTTYPLYQAPLAAVLALRRYYVPIITVVTDLFNVHGLWFNDEVDLCLAPTEAVAAKARLYGVPAQQVIVTGLPVNPALARPADRPALRAELGWRTDRATALLVGSKRVRRLGPVIQALNHSGLPLQLITVAGGNEALLAQLEQTEWHLPARAYGYVTNLARMMLAADFIVCKAGGLIVSEALAAGLPLLLVEALPGQETGNADYVVQEGAGELAPGGLEALQSVFHWLDHDAALLAARAANARRVGRPQAAYEAADLIWQAALRGPQRTEHRLLEQLPLLRELLGTD